MKRRKILLIRKRKKKNKISLDGKGQKCLISITRKICFVWSGFRIGSGKGKGKGGRWHHQLPLWSQSSVSPTGHSGNTAFLAQYLVAQTDTGKLSRLFILPKQLDHIKRQQLNDVLSNQIIQCLQINQGNEAGVWPVAIEGRCCMYRYPHITVLPIYGLLSLYNITFQKSPLKFTFKLTLLNHIQYIH